MMTKVEELIRNAGIKACLFYNCTKDRVIYEYHADDRLPMASVTKLFTALAVREQVSDPDNVFFTTEEDCADYVQANNASVAGFVSFPGRRFSVTEYLYGLLLSSGGDAAYTLGKNLGNGSLTAFVERMNAAAARLGCRNTHLADVAGFGAKEQHYSTAKDICQTLCHAMKDPLLGRILLTVRHVAGKDDPWIMDTCNFLNLCMEDTFFSYSLGGKTGTTLEAGLCYCGMFERNGQQYVFVELGASYDLSEEQRYRLYKVTIPGILCEFFSQSGPFMHVRFSGHYFPVSVGMEVRPEVQILHNNTPETPHLKFSTDAPDIASVDEKGIITVCGKGVARIGLTAQTGDYDILYVNSTGSKYVELSHFRAPASGPRPFGQDKRVPQIRYRKPERIYKERAAENDFCSLDVMPEHLVRILILIEDFSFFRHHGIQPKAILEALWINLRTGKSGLGGSTITQQLCKNLYFGCIKTFRRKLSELGRTLLMERELSKQQILELYLNCVYFDNGTYGITEAARFYFDETPAELTFRQSFLLISLLPVAGKYNPLAHPKEFYKYMMNNARALHRKRLITDAEMEELLLIRPECLDEKLRKPDENTAKYAVHGPFINERYGPFPAIREEEKAVICTVCGEAMHAADAVQKAIAHVIANRIGTREWSRYQTAEEIVKYTGFNACDFRAKYFREAESYLEGRFGYEKFERVIRNVLPVLRKEEEDFTGGCVMFYSPRRFRREQIKAGNTGQKVPGWDFSLLERVKFPGLRGDFSFYRYRDPEKKESITGEEIVKTLSENGVTFRETKGFRKETFTSLCFHSDKAEKGSLLFAKGSGFRKEYLEEAVSRGISGYAAEQPFEVSVPGLLVSDCKEAMGIISRAFYDDPQKELVTAAVTGTNGKTTTVHFLEKIFEMHSGKKTGCIATDGCFDGTGEQEMHMTTPESVDSYGMMRSAADSGCRYFVMECSSQSEKMKRLAGMQFDVGIFTNITDDHYSPLEHGSFEEYLSCKLGIVKRFRNAVVNLDDPHAKEVLAAAKGAGRIVTCSVRPETGADMYVKTIKEMGLRPVFTAVTPEWEQEIEVPVPGLFNISNALEALAAGYVMGIAPETIAEGIKKTFVHGRMFVYDINGYPAVVDYAHNFAAVRSALEAVRELYPEKKIVMIFGCPGTTGLQRRKDMVLAAKPFAEKVYITNDDPHDVDPQSIICEIAFHASEAGIPYEIITDRKECIEKAVREMTPDQILFVTAKGNERFIKTGKRMQYYEGDPKVVERALYEKTFRTACDQTAGGRRS